MIPSLAHLSVLAIPRGVNLTVREEAVLTNIRWDTTRKFSIARSHGQKLIAKLKRARSKIDDSMRYGIDDDIYGMCYELRELYDDTMVFRNAMSTGGLLSSNFVYMDYLISRVLCSPLRNTEAEELYHMLKGSITTWDKISPKFTLDSYTATERELHSFIMKFRSASFRSFGILDRSSIKGIDEIMKLSVPVLDINSKLQENEYHTMFLKKINNYLVKHVPYYKIGNDPEDSGIADLSESDLEDGEIPSLFP